MNKLVIPARNIEVDYPSTWDEIGEKHAERIGEILHLAYMGKIDYDMARKLCIDRFLNRINNPVKPTVGDKAWNYWANEGTLAGSVDFLFEIKKNYTNLDELHEGAKGRNGEEAKGRKGKEAKGRKGDVSTSLSNPETVSINPKFCTQLVPRVKVGWRTYIGPKDLLADLTIFEFKEASWRIGKYAETLDDRYLDELFGVLYRREGLLRYARNDRAKVRSCEGQSHRIARTVPIGIKFMVYLFFLGCMNWMREESIEIDGKEICFGCLFPKATPDPSKGGEKGEGDQTGMAGILFQMAESGVFGNMEQTSNVSMWDVFLRLYQIHWQIKNTNYTN